MSVKVKHPVISSQSSQSDVVNSLNNLRSYFKQCADNGGLVTKQDLVDAKLITSNMVKPSVVVTPAPTVTLESLLNLPALPEDDQVYILAWRSGAWAVVKLPIS